MAVICAMAVSTSVMAWTPNPPHEVDERDLTPILRYSSISAGRGALLLDVLFTPSGDAVVVAYKESCVLLWPTIVHNWPELAMLVSGIAMLPALAAILWDGRSLRRARRHTSRLRQNQCLRCGYLLHGLPEESACPECGARAGCEAVPRTHPLRLGMACLFFLMTVSGSAFLMLNEMPRRGFVSSWFDWEVSLPFGLAYKFFHDRVPYDAWRFRIRLDRHRLDNPSRSERIVDQAVSSSEFSRAWRSPSPHRTYHSFLDHPQASFIALAIPGRILTLSPDGRVVVGDLAVSDLAAGNLVYSEGAYLTFDGGVSRRTFAIDLKSGEITGDFNLDGETDYEIVRERWAIRQWIDAAGRVAESSISREGSRIWGGISARELRLPIAFIYCRSSVSDEPIICGWSMRPARWMYRLETGLDGWMETTHSRDGAWVALFPNFGRTLEVYRVPPQEPGPLASP